LGKKQKGVRALRLKCHRVDDKIIEVEIGTNRPSRNAKHLFKFFENNDQPVYVLPPSVT
jgi:protein ImuB